MIETGTQPLQPPRQRAPRPELQRLGCRRPFPQGRFTVANPALDRSSETLSVCREVRQEFRIENQEKLEPAYPTDRPDTRSGQGTERIPDELGESFETKAS